MLAAPMQGDSGGVHDLGGGGWSTEDAARRASGPRVAVAGAGCRAGPSRGKAVEKRGGDSTAGASNSDFD